MSTEKIDGVRATYSSPAEARALKIEMVYQDLSLCDTIDVAGNLFLGRELIGGSDFLGFLDKQRMLGEARRMLESAVMADFVVRATVKDIAALKRHIAEQRAVSATGGANERNRLLGDFHTLIARLAGNEVVAEMVEELVARTSLITLFYQNTGGAAESLDDHLSLMSAIEARDVQTAVRLIGEHLSGVEGSLILKEDTAFASDLKLALALE